MDNRRLVRQMKAVAIDQLQSANDIYSVISNLMEISNALEKEPEEHDKLMEELNKLFDLANNLSLEAKKVGDVVKASSAGAYE